MNVIEFPGLWGLSLNIDRTAFKVFGMEVYWYGIIIALGLLIAMFLAVKDSPGQGLEQDTIIDLVLYGAPVSIIFARIYYVIFSWDQFRDEPLQIFNIRRGGLAIYGSVMGALLVTWIFGKRKKIAVLKLLDFCMPYFALAQSIGRWGNFVNQEAFGTNTNLPWGMTGNAIKAYLTDLSKNPELMNRIRVKIDPGMPVHPTFLYESLWNLGVFLFLMWFRKRMKVKGELFFLYMILYGAGRFWIEALRTDSLWVGNFRISQILALLFTVSLSIVIYVRRKKFAEADEPVEIGSSSYGVILKEMIEEEGKNIDTDEGAIEDTEEEQPQSIDQGEKEQ